MKIEGITMDYLYKSFEEYAEGMLRCNLMPHNHVVIKSYKTIWDIARSEKIKDPVPPKAELKPGNKCEENVGIHKDILNGWEPLEEVEKNKVIDVNVPKGYELTGEYRKPKKGEWYLSSDRFNRVNQVKQATVQFSTYGQLILREKELRCVNCKINVWCPGFKPTNKCDLNQEEYAIVLKNFEEKVLEKNTSDKYIKLTDWNEVAIKKEYGECYYKLNGGEKIEKSENGDSMDLTMEYYKLNPDYCEFKDDELVAGRFGDYESGRVKYGLFKDVKNNTHFMDIRKITEAEWKVLRGEADEEG